DKDTIAIEAAYGLGEVVVSGSLNPDRYLVSKKKGKIIKKDIARQTWTVRKVNSKDHSSHFWLDHLLDRYGNADFEVVKTLGLAVVDAPRLKERSPAFFNCPD
ncbi:unnamed protein product, partial [marine sediment metagenome]